MKKHTVIETLDSFEDEFDAEILIEKLLFVEKVEKGLKDAVEGRVIDYKEVKQKFFDKCPTHTPPPQANARKVVRHLQKHPRENRI